MKKRFFLVLLFIIFLIVLLCTVVFATVTNNENNIQILTGEKVSSVEETYKEINTSLMNLNSTKDVLNIANEYLEDINVESTVFSNENSIIKEFSNALDSRLETVISNDNAIITINSQTGELLSYINNKTEFEVNTLDDAGIKEKAIEIFNNLNNIDKDDYKLVYIEEFDEEIWRACFAKEYDGLINESESVKFSFCPETGELVTLSINKIDFDNNEIILSENDARNIAQVYLDESVADDMNIDIEIVEPNYFYADISNDDSIYVNVMLTRRAYVCTFNNEAESKVYVDCTNGEIIGGDMIMGGVY